MSLSSKMVRQALIALIDTQQRSADLADQQLLLLRRRQFRLGDLSLLLQSLHFLHQIPSLLDAIVGRKCVDIGLVLVDQQAQTLQLLGLVGRLLLQTGPSARNALIALSHQLLQFDLQVVLVGERFASSCLRIFVLILERQGHRADFVQTVAQVLTCVGEQLVRAKARHVELTETIVSEI